MTPLAEQRSMRVRSLHAHRIEQISFDAAARRIVRSDLRHGLCRALIAEVVIDSDQSVQYYLTAAMRDLVKDFPTPPAPPCCGS